MDSESNKLPGTDSKAPSSDKMDDAAKKKKPLLSKSLICKLIAEFVRSYAGCAKLVTEHHYSSGANEKITEVRFTYSLCKFSLFGERSNSNLY